MRVLIQRVSAASVEIENKIKSSIKTDQIDLVGIEENDSQSDCEWLTSKIVNLRIFDDENSVMNLSVKDIEGDMLVISQFTLHALTQKGNRPSYIKAAKHETAIPLYDYFCKSISEKLGREVETGVFGADMQVSLVNNGPVTIWMDSKNRE